jgi:hypothetical protein
MTTPSLGLRAALVVTSLLAAAPAVAQPPNRSITVQGTLAGEPAAAAPGLSLQAAGWLDGDVEATARFAYRSAPRTGGRGASAALAGLRWAPDTGRWRPALSLEAGAAWGGWRGATAAGALRAGLEWFPRRDWSVSAGLGLAWDGRAVAPEGLLGVSCYF